MELKFTPTIINEIEVENGNRSFTTLLGDIRWKMLATWIKKGMSLDSDEKAFEEIQKYFAEGHDIQDLLVEIFQALQDGGFLDKKKDIKKTLKEAQEKVDKGLPVEEVSKKKV